MTTDLISNWVKNRKRLFLYHAPTQNNLSIFLKVLMSLKWDVSKTPFNPLQPSQIGTYTVAWCKVIATFKFIFTFTANFQTNISSQNYCLFLFTVNRLCNTSNIQYFSTICCWSATSFTINGIIYYHYSSQLISWLFPARKVKSSTLKFLTNMATERRTLTDAKDKNESNETGCSDAQVIDTKTDFWWPQRKQTDGNSSEHWKDNTTLHKFT